MLMPSSMHPHNPHQPAGYAALQAWASTLGEHAGPCLSDGTGFARWLRIHGQAVVKADRAARRR